MAPTLRNEVQLDPDAWGLGVGSAMAKCECSTISGGIAYAFVVPLELTAGLVSKPNSAIPIAELSSMGISSWLLRGAGSDPPIKPN